MLRTKGIPIFLALLLSTFAYQSKQNPTLTTYDGRLQPMALNQIIKYNCYDRQLLLVCSKYCNLSLPESVQQEILRLLVNWSIQRAIPFSVHERTSLAGGTSSSKTPSLSFANSCAKIETHADVSIIYVVAQKPFIFDFKKSPRAPWKKQIGSLSNWLNTFQAAKNLLQAVNATELEKKIQTAAVKTEDRSQMIALLLFSNRCPFGKTPGSDMPNDKTRDWWSKIAESMADHIDRVIFLQMDIDDDRKADGYNEIFMRHRLPSIDLGNGECPRLILTKRNHVYLDYHLHSQSAKSFPELYHNQTAVHIRRFILEALIYEPKKEWSKLGEPLTDIEYIFYSQEYSAQAKMMNKKFIAIGTTGGIGVIVLAITIFWGLKSSSFSGSVTQTAILALTEANPTLILATNNQMKRHASL